MILPEVDWIQKKFWILFWFDLSKTGCQKYGALFPGDPMLSCFCSLMCLSLWRNMQILWTRLLHHIVFLFKQYNKLIHVNEKSFCLFNWIFSFVGPCGPISYSNGAKKNSCIWGLMPDVKISASGNPVRHDCSFQSNCSIWNHLLQIKLALSFKWKRLYCKITPSKFWVL